MKRNILNGVIFAALVCVPSFITTIAHAAAALPSWNDGKAKQSIVDFVAKVTKEGSPGFVPPAERIATFDNNGTLWAELIPGVNGLTTVSPASAASTRPLMRRSKKAGPLWT